MASAETRELNTTDDIRCAESGCLLLAKGREVSPALVEKLRNRKLARPVEMSLTAANPLNGGQLADIAQGLLNKYPSLSRLAGYKVATVIRHISALEIQPPIELLLSSGEQQSNHSLLEHAVAVCLVATSLAVRASWSEITLERVALASLIHDIGELYVNPAYLNHQRELSLKEWQHVVVHPTVGALFVREMTSYSPHIVHMVATHHERMDGTGYPEKITQRDFPLESQLISIAETITGILLHRDNALCRAAFALKVVFREYDPALVGLVTSQINPAECHLPDDFDLRDAMSALQTQYEKTRRVMHISSALMSRSLSTQAKFLASRCFALTSKLYASLNATGALEYCHYRPIAGNDEAEMLLSLEIIPKELQWRMRNLARDVELASQRLSGAESDVFRELKHQLADETIIPLATSLVTR